MIDLCFSSINFLEWAFNYIFSFEYVVVKGGGNDGQNPKKFIPGHRKCRSDGASIFFACGRTSQGGSNETLPWNANSSEWQDMQQRKLLIDDSILDDSTSSPATNLHDLSGEETSSERILLPVPFSNISKGGSSSLGSRSGRTDSAGSRKNSWSQFANLQESGTRCVFQVNQNFSARLRNFKHS